MEHGTVQDIGDEGFSSGLRVHGKDIEDFLARFTSNTNFYDKTLTNSIFLSLFWRWASLIQLIVWPHSGKILRSAWPFTSPLISSINREASRTSPVRPFSAREQPTDMNSPMRDEAKTLAAQRWVRLLKLCPPCHSLHSGTNSLTLKARERGSPGGAMTGSHLPLGASTFYQRVVI